MRKITALYVVGTDAPEDIRFASPYDLFRRSDGMSALLTACGEPPELLPDGGAPDYDSLRRCAAPCRSPRDTPCDVGFLRCWQKGLNGTIRVLTRQHYGGI